MSDVRFVVDKVVPMNEFIEKYILVPYGDERVNMDMCRFAFRHQHLVAGPPQLPPEV